LCKDCDFIFVRPTPDPSTYYAEAGMPDLGAGVWNRHYLESIEKHSAGTGKLLEIGFGDAGFLKMAHDKGWEVYGADLNKSQVRHATEALKLPNIACGTIEELGYSPEYFDVVAAFNFIEHVPDPRATLQSIWRIVRPGGLVILLCPNISGIYHLLIQDIFPDSDPLNLTWVPPDHVGYFNKRNLKLLIENAGFRVVGDESHRTSDLWRQHEMTIGPKVTEAKLRQLLAEINSSLSPAGEARVAVYRDRILKLLLERMCWAMVSDIMELEPALGAENAILFVGQKSGA
jgi:2-polyprenyl-3-methyl-5-hydroxy-6-metoxy-1,4-benzoquinol methylase